ncbi:hypothetical protein [Nocardioides koreensis]
MRRTLGPLLLTALLTAALTAGCGSDDSTVSDQGSPSPESTESTESGAVEFDQVALVSQSGAGGRVGERATVLDDSAAVTAFSRQFRTDAVANRIESEIRRADVPDDQTVLGAVVSVGCDVPPGVTVQRVDGAVVITPMKVKSPLQECLVAVTTVALVAVDSDAV